MLPTDKNQRTVIASEQQATIRSDECRKRRKINALQIIGTDKTRYCLTPGSPDLNATIGIGARKILA
jgi:hypothetical protein